MHDIRGTNAGFLAKRLRAVGVRYVFGIPSGQILAVIEAFEACGIRFILVSHEMTAAFMADVVGRLTGVPGVALATLGPGATNLATGVGNALLDRSPCLIVTGQVPSAQFGRRVQMHVDHRQLFQPLTKGSFLLAPGRMAETIDGAVALATAEPPGPVHLDLLDDFAVAPAREKCRALPRPPKTGQAPLRGVAAAVKALRAAERPVAALGLSAARLGLGRQIGLFLRRHRMPFVTTMMGKGVVPDEHPLCIGVVGRARHRQVERFLADADLVLGIGYDPVEIGYEDWMPAVPLVHVDRERVDADGRVCVAAELTGDLGAALEALGAAGLARTAWDLTAIRDFRAQLAASLRPASRRFQPWEVLDLLRDWLPADGILACDVGAHTHVVAAQWPLSRPGTLLVSNGWSSMGYAIPAALAAKLVRPNREVTCVVGDGGFLMQAGEMATAARLGSRVTFVLLRDESLSLIRAKQARRGYRPAGVGLPSGTMPPPAHYFGVPCVPARSSAEFRTALARARRS
ncbi:MAG: thiamine pyrophosphate-binding protein, partial [Zetaproteobacteria bacterium]